MSIDERLVRALAQLVQAGRTHQRACLIGGQALRDLYGALQVRLGTDIPAVRASMDLDLLLSVGDDPGADRALRSELEASWMQKSERPATYVWREDPAVELDLTTTYGASDAPAKAVKISIEGSGRILAYRVIPLWLFELNLIEPCHGAALRRVGLERLRQTSLLVSKLLAVDSCLQALTQPEPPSWTMRVDRDLADVLYLTHRQLQPGLWCAASTAKRHDLNQRMEPLFSRLTAWAKHPPGSLSKPAHLLLTTVVDGLPIWWRPRERPPRIS